MQLVPQTPFHPPTPTSWMLSKDIYYARFTPVNGQFCKPSEKIQQVTPVNIYIISLITYEGMVYGLPSPAI